MKAKERELKKYLESFRRVVFNYLQNDPNNKGKISWRDCGEFIDKIFYEDVIKKAIFSIDISRKTLAVYSFAELHIQQNMINDLICVFEFSGFRILKRKNS